MSGTLGSASPRHARLEHILDVLTIAFAVLALPSVIMQVSESESIRLWGESLGIVVWLYFVIDVAIHLRIAPDNIAWIRSHRFEVAVVVLSSPLLTGLSHGESPFQLLPLVFLARVPKIFKAAKVVKVLKIFKSGKIAAKFEQLPKWIMWIVGGACVAVGLGLTGMIVDPHAHSLQEGFRYWLASLGSGLRFDSLRGVSTVAILFVLIVAFRRRVGKAEKEAIRG